MGGRGASSGMSDSGKPYGSEYKTLAQFGNIKVVKYLDTNSTKSPMETMTRGRVYATLDGNNNIKYITFYDVEGERTRQIDVTGPKHGELEVPHTHIGYEHDEYGTRKPNAKEQKIIDRILLLWDRKRKKIGL